MWPGESYTSPFSFTAFDLEFATVLICCLSEGMNCGDGTVKVGEADLKPFLTAGGEGLQSKGRWWPGGIEGEHKIDFRGTLLSPPFHTVLLA